MHKKEEQKQKRLGFFYENYDLAHGGMFPKKKTYLGSNVDKKCRFCGRMSPEVSFRKEAHAFPELLGNKTIFLNYECDACNDKFSKSLENELANFLTPTRTISQTPGKRGVPKYKTKNGLSTIAMDQDGLIYQEHAADPFLMLDLENKKLKLQVDRPPFTPVAVYKCFSKMALAVLPENCIQEFVRTIQWVSNENHGEDEYIFRDLKLVMGFTPGPNPHVRPASFCFTKKKEIINETIPNCIFIIAFNNLFFQMFLPLHQSTEKGAGKSKLINMTIFPSPAEIKAQYGETKFRFIDCSSREKQPWSNVPVTISFQNAVETT